MATKRQYLTVLLLLLASPFSAADVPQMVQHTGRVTVLGQPLNGPGYFKFAIVNKHDDCALSKGACKSLWSNDQLSQSGSEPKHALKIPVNNGIYSVALGDVSISNVTDNLLTLPMPPLTVAVFSDQEVMLRVWFSDSGTDGSFEQMSPDRPLLSAPYAFMSQQSVLARQAERAKKAEVATNSEDSLGIGQQWYAYSYANGDPATTRYIGRQYLNDTKRPINVQISATCSQNGGGNLDGIDPNIHGLHCPAIFKIWATASSSPIQLSDLVPLSIIVPPGSYYQLDLFTTSGPFGGPIPIPAPITWNELR